MKQKQRHFNEIEPSFVEYLSGEELFLLGFLQGFNRKNNDILIKEGLEQGF